MTTGVVFCSFILLSKLNLFSKIFYLAPPLIFTAIFFYMLKAPDVIITRREKEISKEVVFAGRFLIIELESGVPIYDCFINISQNYEVIGKYFKEITNKVNMGTAVEDALNEAVELIPSNDLRRIIWQILNSMRTGSNIATSLKSILEQIDREQNIEVQKYGRKLNPLAMFYMIIAVILPSLGTTMMIILSSFVQFEVNLTILLFIVFAIGFIQFMFLAIIRFSRPAVEM